MRSPKQWMIIGVLLSVIVVAAFLWQKRRTDQAEAQLGLDASRTISEAFAKSRSLRVATLTGEVIAKGSDAGFMNLLPATMTVKMPYQADYFVDLYKVQPSSFRWNRSTRTMTVRVPDVTVERPNIDASKATYQTTGPFISRGAAQRLMVQSAGRAGMRAKTSAEKPEHMDAARISAREAMQALVSGPLRAAQLGDVKVRVRFPWEPIGDRDGELVDGSTPLSEIYRR